MIWIPAHRGIAGNDTANRTTGELGILTKDPTLRMRERAKVRKIVEEAVN